MTDSPPWERTQYRGIFINVPIPPVPVTDAKLDDRGDFLPLFRHKSGFFIALAQVPWQ